MDEEFAGFGGSGAVGVHPLSFVPGHFFGVAREAQAIALWMARGSKALPEIVTLLEHPYLGVRIGGWTLVQKLHPSKVPFDPWALLPDRTAMIKALRDEHKAID